MTLFDQGEEPVEVTGAGIVPIATHDPGRAVRFYGRVFGFRVVAEPRDGGTTRVLMQGRGGVRLSIREQRGAVAVPRCLLFASVDLEDARARLWDLGVALADGIEARFDPERRCRSLRVRDPDGNEIELVEAPLVPASARKGRGKEVSFARP